MILGSFFCFMCVPTASISSDMAAAILPQIFHSGKVLLKLASLFHARDSFLGSPFPQYALLFWLIPNYKKSLLEKHAEVSPEVTCTEQQRGHFDFPMEELNPFPFAS